MFFLFFFLVLCIYCRTIGEIFAVSIVQGGPPPNFFMPWCYHFISSGELDYETVTEGDVQELNQQVESTSSEILTYPYVNYSSENCLAFLRAFHVCILIKIRENKYIDSKVLCVKRSGQLMTPQCWSSQTDLWHAVTQDLCPSSGRKK